MSERILLGKVTLRNERQVFRQGADYVVEQRDPKGHLHSNIVSQRTVMHVLSALAGSEVTADDAADILQTAATHLDLPYDHGFKLRFYAQSVLVALVVLGKAQMQKRGRRFYYRLES